VKKKHKHRTDQLQWASHQSGSLQPVENDSANVSNREEDFKTIYIKHIRFRKF